jgi:hypothetical protein
MGQMHVAAERGIQLAEASYGHTLASHGSKVAS